MKTIFKRVNFNLSNNNDFILIKQLVFLILHIIRTYITIFFIRQLSE